MGTIKFEIDLPEFEKELNISVTIRRDGEVIYNTSSPSTGGDAQKDNGKDKATPSFIGEEMLGDEIIKPRKKTAKTSTVSKSVNPDEVKKPKLSGGNFMGVDF